MAKTLIARMTEAWLAPAASYRREWAAGAPERRLVAYAFGACALLTLATMGAETIRPAVATAEIRDVWFATQVFVGLSFFPLALYGSAALIRILARAAGGTGGWRETRLALFWSGLVSGPAALALILAGAALGIEALARPAAGLIWAALLAPMLAAAHGFRASRVIAAFAALAAGAYLLPAFG